MILDLILLGVFNSFLIIGIRMSVDYESSALCGHSDDCNINKIIPKSTMIFWKVRYYGLKYLPMWLSKPLFECCTCMASIHSVYVYWYMYSWSVENLIIYLVYIGFLGGLTTYIWNKIEF